MTKKILLSVAAAALLSTSAFAGTMSTDKGHEKISTESYMQNGMDIIDFRSLRYTATVERNVTGPGGTILVTSISDPLIQINITEIEFAYHKDSTGTVVQGFDEKGKGMTPAELILVQNDAAKTLLEQDYFSGSTLTDIKSGNPLPLIFNQINVEGDKYYAEYDGSSLTEVKNGHTFQLNSAVGLMPFKYQKDKPFIGAKLFSVTIDNSYIDEAKYEPTTTLVPQFKVSCVRKFDGLINFENDRVSFVNPAHGERLIALDANQSGNQGNNNPSLILNDSVINNDRMVFKIENARPDFNDGTRWMSGRLSEFRFSASNDANPFEDPAEWVITADKFAAATADGLDTLTTPSNTYTVAGSKAFVEQNPSDRAPGIEFDDTTDIFTITHEDAEIASGTTTYEVNFKKVPSDTPIRPVQFRSVSIDLEGGIKADDYKDREDGTGVDRILEMSVGGDQPINYDHNMSAPGSHFVINDVDDGTEAIQPQVPGTATLDKDIGEWMDHAFIAQIAGASSTAAGMQTKLFIVNRSCTTVTPHITLIKDGEKLPLTGVASIDPDNQGFYNIGALLETMTPGSTAGQDYAKYAIEVTMPGIAEEYYMYAQVKNATAGQFKDLPVYTTSNRD